MSMRAKRIVLLAAAAAIGCGSGDGSAGMSGRQVARAHDVGDVFFGNSTTVGFTRQTSGSSQAEPEDLWVWGLADAAPEVGLPDIDWSPPLRWPIVRVGSLLQTGATAREFYDFTSRVGVDLTASMATPLDAGLSVDGGIIPASQLYPAITAVRRDGAAVALTDTSSGGVGVGPIDGLQSFALPGAVGGLDFIGADLALLYAPAPETDGSVGVYRLGASSGELTELVPPAPAADWVGTLGACPTAGPSPCSLFVVAGCAATDPPCPGTSTPPCGVVYVKADPDNPGQTAAFGYDLNAGRAIKLPGQGPTHLYVSPDQQTVLYDDDLQISKRYWSLCNGGMDFCPYLAGSFVLWRPDSKGFVSIIVDGSVASAPLAVANFAGGVCTGQSVASSVSFVGYSPAGDSLAWSTIGSAGGSDDALFLAQPDGSAAVSIASGPFTGVRFSPDGQRLLIARSSTSSVSLFWIDLTASPPAEHLLASDYGGFSRGGSRRALLVDHWNTQDASGELALIDVDSGARQTLGRAVTGFASWGNDVDAAGTNVAYAVRSRVPSDRDGLWLTALPP